MSSSPDSSAVRELRKTVKEFRRLGGEIDFLQSTISSVDSKLKLALERRRVFHERIIKLLEEMDCAANGNHGWHERIAWMLGEFDQQASAVDSPVPESA